MTNKKESEDKFMAGLAARLSAGAPATTHRHGAGVNASMIMNEQPKGASKSLAEMFADEDSALVATLNTSGNSDASTVPSSKSPKVISQIPVHLIDDSPYQPRKKYDETAIQGLGALLAADGQNDPVLARLMDGGRYQLISGHRRTRAARLLGWAHIDAILISKDEFQTKATTFFSNEGHVGLTEYERALMFQASLTEKVVADQEALAKRTGLSSGRISQIMSMLEFPAAFINLLDTYPGLFGYRIGAEIRKLLKAHPAAADTILQGVERLIDDPKLSEVDLREFVARKLKTKVARRQPPLPVQDAKGKPIFTVEVTEKRITIDIKEAVDVEKLGKRTLASLREFVATLNVTDEK